MRHLATARAILCAVLLTGAAHGIAAESPHHETLLVTSPRLGEVRRINAREALQAIALFRLVLPSAWLRLAGGRELVLGELQAMGMLAGANALIVGNYLTTGGRPAEEDLALLDALGMPVVDGPGEGRFVVDGDGAHARPARAPRTSIPVTSTP